jgi:hypothetical protein
MMSDRIEIFELIERLDAASRDETLADGMLYRAAAERLAADRIAELEHKLVRHGHCPKCNGVYSRRAGVGCLACGYLEQGDVTPYNPKECADELDKALEKGDG